jgi:hypothetical protein
MTTTAWILLFAAGLIICDEVTALPQVPSQSPPSSASVERVLTELRRAPRLQITFEGLQAPVAVFRMTVERDYMPSLNEQLEKEFKLNAFQRQSQEWSSKCCGLNLIELTNNLDKALKRREARKIHNQVARELAQIEAAAKK